MNNEIEYIIKEKIVSLKNRDWSRFTEIEIFEQKCCLSTKEKKYIEFKIKE